MKILVKAVAPLADLAVVRCTSDADFLVYGTTNGAGDCVIESRSTGATVDTRSPTFSVARRVRTEVEQAFVKSLLRSSSAILLAFC
jgi:hypothetical protein